jgi:hypothetical protein
VAAWRFVMLWTENISRVRNCLGNKKRSVLIYNINRIETYVDEASVSKKGYGCKWTWETSQLYT